MFEALVILVLWQLCRFIKHIFKISTRDISDDEKEDDFINNVIYLYEEDDGDDDD